MKVRRHLPRFLLLLALLGYGAQLVAASVGHSHGDLGADSASMAMSHEHDHHPGMHSNDAHTGASDDCCQDQCDCAFGHCAPAVLDSNGFFLDFAPMSDGGSFPQLALLTLHSSLFRPPIFT